jgi:hypothetical protein
MKILALVMTALLLLAAQAAARTENSNTGALASAELAISVRVVFAPKKLPTRWSCFAPRAR